jgi:hypothetical protein
MSHVYDPLPDLKRWLEAIAINVEQTSFTFDNEGNFIKFDAQRRYQSDKCQLSVIWEDDIENKNNLEFQAEVERKQLVEAFYCSMINMFESDKYEPRQWEWKSMHQQLCQMLEMNYVQLVNHCLNISKQQFAELLSRGRNNNTEPDDWNIPDNYDTLNIEEKKPIVYQMLNQVNVNPYDGTSKKDFQSEIIENYLEISKPTPKQHFLVMADFPSAWGWVMEEGDSFSWQEYGGIGTIEIEGVPLNESLTKKLAHWQNIFSKNYENPEMDWETFNKTGVRLAILLKKQIGHLYDKFYYDPPFEDWTNRKMKIKIEII